MENKSIKINILSLLTVVFALFLSSCSDWTETESVAIVEPDIKKQNPELYGRYLDNLKAYKASDHKVLYAWFNNSEKVPFNRSQHVENLPDSIDVVVLTHPDNLTDSELSEINTLRNDKGTKFFFPFSYDAVKLKYDTMLKEWEEAGKVTPEPKGFAFFLTDTLQYTFKVADKYDYDGIVFRFNGKSLIHLDVKQKEEQTLLEDLFIGIIRAWMNNDKDKIVVFEGKPQNLLNKPFLQECRHIVLPMPVATNASNIMYNVLSACEEGVPVDRFVITTETTSVDPADTKTGYWTDGTRSLISTATWAAASYNDFSIAGLAVYSVNNDYFNLQHVYGFTKAAIDILNPSLKNN